MKKARAHGPTHVREKNEGREIRTPNLLIWSQTRYRCAIHPMLAMATSAKNPCGTRLLELKTRFKSYAFGLLVASNDPDQPRTASYFAHVLAPLA